MKYRNIKDGYKLEIWYTLDDMYLVRVEKNSKTLFMNKSEDLENIEKIFEDPIITDLVFEIYKRERKKVKNLISEGIYEIKEKIKAKS